jgi:hypothetical protein
MVFRSSLTASSAAAPSAGAPFVERARTGRWQVLAACAT